MHTPCARSVTALGAQSGVSGAGRPGEGSPLLAATWLRVHDVRDLYVQFAWDMSHPALLAAVDLARVAGVHLWLVGDTPFSDYHAELLSSHEPRQWTQVEFLHHWRHLTTDSTQPEGAAHSPRAPAGRATPTATPSDRWPATLPDDDFTTFRAACRDLLPQLQFEVVDRAFLAGRTDAAATLVPLLDAVPSSVFGQPRRTDDAHEKAVNDWFAHRWEDTASLQHFQVTIRSAQVAAFHAGYLVQVDLDQLVGVSETSPRRAQRNPDTWVRLRAYAQPHRSAACALAAAGIGTDLMSRLAISCYDVDTGVVRSAGDDLEVTIEPAAREFMNAQQTLRTLQGAKPDEPLLVNPRTGKPLSPRTLATSIRQVRRELGVAVALAAPDTLTPDPARWSRRWGISIQELA